jgi:hypothetical protein
MPFAFSTFAAFVRRTPLERLNIKLCRKELTTKPTKNTKKKITNYQNFVPFAFSTFAAFVRRTPLEGVN